MYVPQGWTSALTLFGKAKVNKPKKANPINNFFILFPFKFVNSRWFCFHFRSQSGACNYIREPAWLIISKALPISQILWYLCIASLCVGLYLVNFAIFQSASQGGFVVYSFLKQREGGSRFQKNEILINCFYCVIYAGPCPAFCFYGLKKGWLFFGLFYQVMKFEFYLKFQVC